MTKELHFFWNSRYFFLKQVGGISADSLKIHKHFPDIFLFCDSIIGHHSKNNPPNLGFSLYP